MGAGRQKRKGKPHGKAVRNPKAVDPNPGVVTNENRKKAEQLIHVDPQKPQKHWAQSARNLVAGLLAYIRFPLRKRDER